MNFESTRRHVPAYPRKTARDPEAFLERVMERVHPSGVALLQVENRRVTRFFHISSGGDCEPEAGLFKGHAFPLAYLDALSNEQGLVQLNSLEEAPLEARIFLRKIRVHALLAITLAREASGAVQYLVLYQRGSAREWTRRDVTFLLRTKSRWEREAPQWS